MLEETPKILREVGRSVWDCHAQDPHQPRTPSREGLVSPYLPCAWVLSKWDPPHVGCRGHECCSCKGRARQVFRDQLANQPHATRTLRSKRPELYTRASLPSPSTLARKHALRASPRIKTGATKPIEQQENINVAL